MSFQYVPHFTTSAGSCLTQANWHDLSIHVGLCDFANIVIKPGIDFWKQGMSLRSYLAWDRILVLDASQLTLNVDAQFVLCSPYDGARIKLSIADFWDLVQQLKPDALLMPADLPGRPMGIIRLLFPGPPMESDTYVRANEVPSFSDSDQHPNVERFLTAKDALFFMHQGKLLYASDQPARDASQGIIYQEEGILDITDPQYRMDFNLLNSASPVLDPANQSRDVVVGSAVEALNAKCICPTCQQSFTRAYLHHLLQSTPLLCHRLLLMHNVHWISQHLLYLVKSSTTQ